MKTYNKMKMLIDNLFKEEQQLKQEQREHKQYDRKNTLEYDTKSLELQVKEQEIAQRKITVLKAEEELLLEDIQALQSSINISFNANEELLADRYVYLKNSIPDLESQRDTLRAQTLSKTQIILAEFSAMIFFIFIITRLAADNITLLESFVVLSLFRDLYGSSMMSLFADLVAQDYLIVLAISFIAAVSYRNSAAFFDARLKTKLLYAFGIGVVGLFISSMLFSY